MNTCEHAGCREEGKSWKNRRFCREHLTAFLMLENARLETDITGYWMPRVRELENAVARRTSEMASFVTRAQAAVHAGVEAPL